MWYIALFSLWTVSGYCMNLYDETLSHIAVNLSQAAYCVSSTWTCATCDKNNILEAIVETHGERALLGYNTEYNTMFVSFRGSTNIQNWIDNIQFRQIYPYNNTSIGVEKGFYKAYQNIKPDVFETLDRLTQKYSTKKLLLTGHSLGAAITTLMAYDVMNMYDLFFFTFGSPRVGNTYFVQQFNMGSSYESMYRVTHYYDIVPHLPQEALGYLHIPYEIWYNEDNTQYKTCNDDTYQEDDECSNSCSPLHCTSTSDHLNYLGIPMGSSNGLC
jgi:predicted lipase